MSTSLYLRAANFEIGDQCTKLLLFSKNIPRSTLVPKQELWNEWTNGGVSHMDTFDHKPELFQADGKKKGVGGGLSNQERVLLKPLWDFKPGGNMAEHADHAKVIDQPIAGWLKDLKQRGMLDDTLVVWTTEFGRTPGVDGDKGRGHHSACFSSWLAGAGVKPGISYGATDEIGATVAENKVHVHDFHATILHLLGIDHTKLTYRHCGRDYRLTDVHGNVVKEILA